MEYNLGTESITIADQTRRFNDGVYHTVRYISVKIMKGWREDKIRES
jgi:hypothetical protein